ncbi:MAG: hypothetical protein RIS94_2014 [Pseudomonadota bacterium]|jgi:NAD(P)-dependent dehydrogenase (short-subunit alcohol dehydrogenase family)
MRFSGKVAMVTGAASGIGLATAQAFAREGAAVALVDRHRDAASTAAADICATGGRAVAIGADVSVEADMLRAVAETVAAVGGLDIAINNAGVVSYPAPVFEEMAIDDWNRQIAINLTGMFLAMRAQVPALKTRGGGVIVNTVSLAGQLAAPGMAGYVAAKHGALGLTKAAALDLIGHGIRVNAVCPGIIDTPLLAGAAADPGMAARLTAAVPAGRMGTPQEVADLILFLASDAAGYLVGAALTMDGGISLQ